MSTFLKLWLMNQMQTKIKKPNYKVYKVKKPAAVIIQIYRGGLSFYHSAFIPIPLIYQIILKSG